MTNRKDSVGKDSVHKNNVHKDNVHKDTAQKDPAQKDSVSQQLADSARVKQALAQSLVDLIVHMAQQIIGCIRKGGKVLFCGNGGSAADAQHLAAELVGRFGRDNPPLAAIALTTDTSVLTCLSNDYGFDQVFSKQVEAHGRKGDVLVGISTSGRSENVLRAVKRARQLGLSTIVLVGSEGGPLAETADLALRVPSDNSQRIQEAHITIGHIVLDLLEKEMAAGSD
jgi:D-sedoheptulose 7-phosphate isomerase